MIRNIAHSELERNYAWVAAGDADARAEYINSMQNRTHRLASLGLLRFASRFPDFTARTLGRSTEGTDFYYIGAGSKHTVLGNGADGNVTKVHRASVFMEEAERQRLAEDFSDRHRTLRRYLGGMTLEQEDFTVEPHPLSPTSRAVVSRQAMVDFIPIDVFSGYTSDIDKKAHKDLVADYPQVEESLAIIAVYGLEMAENEGLIPDVTGLHNVVLSPMTNDILIIGGVPLSIAEEPTQSGLIQSQLHQIVDLSPTESW